MCEEEKEKLIAAFDSNIGEGSRNTYLTSFVGSLRRKGMEEGELVGELIKRNEEQWKVYLYTNHLGNARQLCQNYLARDYHAT